MNRQKNGQPAGKLSTGTPLKRGTQSKGLSSGATANKRSLTIIGQPQERAPADHNLICSGMECLAYCGWAGISGGGARGAAHSSLIGKWVYVCVCVRFCVPFGPP